MHRILKVKLVTTLHYPLKHHQMDNWGVYISNLMDVFVAVYLPALRVLSCTSVSFKILKDVGMELPKSVETRKHPGSKTGDDGMQQ